MSIKPYPKYKDSGVEWIGVVPEHWEISRLKNVFQRMEREPLPDDQIVTAFRDGEVTLRANRRTDGFTNAVHEHGYQRIERGDLVIHAMDAFAGAIGVSDSDGKSTPVYSVCMPKSLETNPHYFAHLLRCMSSRGFIFALAKGIRERSTEFRWNEAANVSIILPTSIEQSAIASFLDHETAKIDALIAEQEKLIELLNEKRSAVISHAVTKGLNLDVKMKDSGVEWLGMVPEGWEIDRFKWSIIICQNGIWGDEPRQDENDIPCVRVADFDRQQLRVVLCEPTIRNVSEKERVGRVLNRGNLLLEKSGGGETQPVGCVVLYDDLRPAVCSNFVARVQVAAQMDASFWRYAHAAAYAVRLNTRSIKQTSGIQNLDSSQYFDERAGFPPYSEQSAIASFLDHETAKIDALTTEAQRAIDLLQERRSALISAAVTGQIDVRDH